ncbi:hypothetical protein O3G_MSEX010115 [Manduca sexta]|uniref:Oxysterol-binding protein n=1 Tax=Manduca sexta TaxID=7130 RepID=A0A921ZHH4_MANSE|nr:hypothetical protein O3G_MSEX010115 [Manduca sexta]
MALVAAFAVSHHPPISACHAESSRWCFWQEARIKTKFWGKSMEFQPTGRVHVRLTTTGDHYSWNKVTTCVHNLFGGQRWVDQYGDMHIVCHGTDITCKLNFIKASSWSSSRHEVRGFVTEGSTGNRLRITGRWSEALYAGDPPAARCLWRPGAMPPEHELYYGFTRFAMELNEMEPGMREVLPHTDTRLRPDQRALEEGDVEAAEQLKHELEQAQRERATRLARPHARLVPVSTTYIYCTPTPRPDQRALEEGDVEAAEQLKHELEQAQRERRRDSPDHTPAWFRSVLPISTVPPPPGRTSAPLEEGDVEAAEQLKHELEQAQRERRRDSPDHTPAWFRKSMEGGEETWVFTGEYWRARDSGFPHLAAPRICVYRSTRFSASWLCRLQLII